jgi:hypothetical protein
MRREKRERHQHQREAENLSDLNLVRQPRKSMLEERQVLKTDEYLRTEDEDSRFVESLRDSPLQLRHLRTDKAFSRT